jgi:exodeoxyribonuclease VII small subunit
MARNGLRPYNNAEITLETWGNITMPGGNKTDKQQSADELTFEQALAQLESIVTAIEQGKIGLQDSIAEYEKGVKLLRRCRAVLAEAEMKIQRLQVTEDGTLTPSPMSPPNTDEE